MAKKLVIVESPAKSKTITKFLGRNFTVKASMGHIRDLPKSQFGVDVEQRFAPKYITIRGKGDILKELRSACKKAETVYLATDPDREGEAIAWHLVQALNLEEGKYTRIEFNEITKPAIQNAIKHPRAIDVNRVEAQQARRILDRIVGYKLSPLLWRKIKKGLSAGRVQSVAVRLICEREEEIAEFIPEEYWTIDADFELDNHKKLLAKLTKKGKENIKPASEAEVNSILVELKGVSYQVAGITKREKRRRPPAPFITSSLQQEAYRKLNFTAKKTMMVAQQLYEGLELGSEGSVGLITYIRTDSVRISEVAIAEVREYIKHSYGDSYLPSEARVFVGKNKSQDAHEAIRPSSVERTPDAVKQFLSRDQYRLYKLIWDRFVACQMSDMVLDTTTIDIQAGAYTFKASGSLVKFIGFGKVYEEGSEDEKDTLLPELSQDQQLKLKEHITKQHFTQPPARYTDASLVKSLEELGIGRPSTYAPIVDTIQKRGYIVKEEKQFYPTELGILVVEMLKEYFPKIIDIDFTVLMERDLDGIAEGQLEWEQVLEDFYPPFAENLEQADEAIGKIEVADEVTDELCPQCGSNLVIKLGRYGKFLACPSFPDCSYTKPLLEETGVKCPECGGEIVKRRSKKGRTFFGCSRYPECNFVSWDQPAGKPCPVCNEHLVTKHTKKGDFIQCSSKTCNYKEVLNEV